MPLFQQSMLGLEIITPSKLLLASDNTTMNDIDIFTLLNYPSQTIQQIQSSLQQHHEFPNGAIFKFDEFEGIVA